MKKEKLIIGATGASGMPILKACLEIIKEDENFQTCLIMSDSAKLTMEHELKEPMNEIEMLADEILDINAIGAGPASGSYQTKGMLIVPCSMKTIAGIHSGYTDNLILRAADVTLKEQRHLVLAARETPLNAIHLSNMYELSLMPGVHIIPPMLTFYQKPKSIEDIVYHMAAKLVEPFGVETKEYRRWKGL